MKEGEQWATHAIKASKNTLRVCSSRIPLPARRSGCPRTHLQALTQL